ncbi:hypothetical protein J4417_00245 [Candidatus Woesearchaeota archaeon]|nr:hypothetical protein [Candidatus Woesearchaeota archaeon]
MVNIKTAIITGLAAFYLGLTSSPALADAPAYSKTTLADKATCSSSSSVELMEKDLTCFTELAKTIQRYDGWQSPCSSEKADPKDGRLGSLEYAKSLIMEYILWNSDCDKVRKGELSPSMIAYLVAGTIKDNFIPADVNGDCYLSPADDLNNDGYITLEDLTAYQATATSSNPKIKCNYEKTEKRK